MKPNTKEDAPGMPEQGERDTEGQREENRDQQSQEPGKETVGREEEKPKEDEEE